MFILVLELSQASYWSSDVKEQKMVIFKKKTTRQSASKRLFSMISTKPFPKLYYLLIYKDVKAFLDRLTHSLKRLMKYSFLTDMLLSISIYSSSSLVFIAHYPTSKNQEKEEQVCLKSVNKCFSLCLKNSIRKLTQLHGRRYLSKQLKL